MGPSKNEKQRNDRCAETLDSRHSSASMHMDELLCNLFHSKLQQQRKATTNHHEGAASAAL
jgi:hypothetical protein